MKASRCGRFRKRGRKISRRLPTKVVLALKTVSCESGEVLAQEIWDGTDGLSVLQSLIAGDLPAPPLARFCEVLDEPTLLG